MVIAHMLMDMIQKGEIHASQLTVVFIDEEGIYPCIEDIVMQWRKRFMLMGAKFVWFCIEVKHFCCFNQLTQDESFICWDSTKQDVWIRQPPSFAERGHPLLNPRMDKYQDFMVRFTKNGIGIVGVRAAESVQRLKYMAKQKQDISTSGYMSPFMDWRCSDVWKYLHENKIDIPQAYLYMYQVGISKNRLRISQFFSIDSVKSLVQMSEFYPDLMDRVIRREPNAYIALLYWDSEMFGKQTRKRGILEQEQDNDVDYGAKINYIYANMGKFFTTAAAMKVARAYKSVFIKLSDITFNQKELKTFCEKLLAGDPKLRSLRSWQEHVVDRKAKRIYKEYDDVRLDAST